ncbi:MAG: hypothetical protein U5L06_13850 [Rhodovibrio sp.]|nr:hypothetical protein [Rhodovibrio sp.]
MSARVDSDFTMAYGVTADHTSNTGFHDLMQALTRVAFASDTDLEAQSQNALRDLAGGRIGLESSVNTLPNGQTRLRQHHGDDGRIRSTFTRADGTRRQRRTTTPASTLGRAGSATSPAYPGLDAEVVTENGSARTSRL